MQVVEQILQSKLGLARATAFATVFSEGFGGPMVSKIPGFRRLELRHSEVFACRPSRGAW